MGNLERQSSLHAGRAAPRGRIETWLPQRGGSAGHCSEGGGSRYARFTGYSISKVDSTPAVWISIRPLHGLLDQRCRLHADRASERGTLTRWSAAPQRRRDPAPSASSGVGGSTWRRRAQTCWSSSPAGAYRDPPTARTSVSLPRPPTAPKAPTSARYATCGRYSGSRGPARREPSEPLCGVSGGGAASSTHGVGEEPCFLPAGRVAPQGRIETSGPQRGGSADSRSDAGGSRYARCAGCSISMRAAVLSLLVEQRQRGLSRPAVLRRAGLQTLVLTVLRGLLDQHEGAGSAVRGCRSVSGALCEGGSNRGRRRARTLCVRALRGRGVSARCASSRAPSG
ncbi:hypothetical protein EDF22_2077 [Rathayibacter sp. PhB127]|nr:hypothetical protein EDF22_2077 [Rathayibacter sp. PhB127]